MPLMAERQNAIRLGPPGLGGLDGRQRMQGAMRRDQQAARARGELKRFGSGRLHMQCDVEAFINAVDQEGHAVLSPEARGYWEDQKRLYPWTNAMPDKCVPGLGARHNRLGRVSFRKVYTKRGAFVAIDAPPAGG